MLVAEKTSCGAAKKGKGKQKNADNCAELCKEENSPMFSFGRSETYYSQYCFCEIGANQNGTCREMTDIRYDLFKYVEGESANMI